MSFIVCVQYIVNVLCIRKVIGTARIRVMINLWRLVYYFVNYLDPGTTSAQHWYSGEINRGSFVNWLLLNKHFREDWRDTFGRWAYVLTGKWYKWSSNQKRARIQQQNVNDILDLALSEGYIRIKRTIGAGGSHTASETLLCATQKGREFLKFLPFMDAVLKRYGYFWSLAFGAGASAIIRFWDVVVQVARTIIH